VTLVELRVPATAVCGRSSCYRFALHTVEGRTAQSPQKKATGRSPVSTLSPQGEQWLASAVNTALVFTGHGFRDRRTWQLLLRGVGVPHDGREKCSRLTGGARPWKHCGQTLARSRTSLGLCRQHLPHFSRALASLTAVRDESPLQDSARPTVDEKSVESAPREAEGGSLVVTLVPRGGPFLGGISNIRLTLQALRLLPSALRTKSWCRDLASNCPRVKSCCRPRACVGGKSFLQENQVPAKR
jgi:hypothetical protein